MKQQSRQTILWLAVLGALALAASLGVARPLVVVTTPDMAALTAAVSGDLTELQVVLPPGADPHDFTITSAQVRGFVRAALVVYSHSQSLEFERVIRAALPDKPALDWSDYAAQGARLHDYPGYPQNPHAFWLSLDNAPALARTIAGGLERLGLPRAVLQERLGQFEREVAAQRALAVRVAQERGLAGRPMLAVIPGVCDVIANFGLPVGDVLMAEGSGTVAGPRLQDAVARLRSGAYSAIVCPQSMRQAKQGEAARQLAADSGAPIIYVHFLDTRLGQDTYLSQIADNTAALAGAGREARAPQATPTGASRGVLVLAGVLGLIAGLALARVMFRPRRPSCGAGIFDRD